MSRFYSLPSCLPAFLPSCLPFSRPSCLPSFPSFFLSFFLSLLLVFLFSPPLLLASLWSCFSRSLTLSMLVCLHRCRTSHYSRALPHQLGHCSLSQRLLRLPAAPPDDSARSCECCDDADVDPCRLVRHFYDMGRPSFGPHVDVCVDERQPAHLGGRGHHVYPPAVQRADRGHFSVDQQHAACCSFVQW